MMSDIITYINNLSTTPYKNFNSKEKFIVNTINKLILIKTNNDTSINDDIDMILITLINTKCHKIANNVLCKYGSSNLQSILILSLRTLCMPCILTIILNNDLHNETTNTILTESFKRYLPYEELINTFNKILDIFKMLSLYLNDINATILKINTYYYDISEYIDLNEYIEPNKKCDAINKNCFKYFSNKIDLLFIYINNKYKRKIYLV